MDATIGLPNILQMVLFSCGILAPLLFLGTDRLAGKLLKGYNFTAQSMSELSAAGSPTRPLVVALNVVAGAILIAFAAGIWQAADQALLPSVVGLLVMANAVTTILATLFFPNRFGVRPVFASAGVIIMFLSVLCSVLAFVFGAFAFPGWIRVLSIAFPAAFILLAGLRFATAAAASTKGALSTGAQERTMAYSFQLWLLALAIYLLLLG
jgi:hypothetical protein